MILFLVALVFTPAYCKGMAAPCREKDGTCLRNFMDSVIAILGEGEPLCNIPRLDPIDLPEDIILTMNEVNVLLQYVTVRGLSSCESSKVSLKDQTLNVTLQCCLSVTAEATVTGVMSGMYFNVEGRFTLITGLVTVTVAADIITKCLNGDHRYDVANFTQNTESSTCVRFYLDAVNNSKVPLVNKALKVVNSNSEAMFDRISASLMIPFVDNVIDQICLSLDLLSVNQVVSILAEII